MGLNFDGGEAMRCLSLGLGLGQESLDLELGFGTLSVFGLEFLLKVEILI